MIIHLFVFFSLSVVLCWSRLCLFCVSNVVAASSHSRQRNSFLFVVEWSVQCVVRVRDACSGTHGGVLRGRYREHHVLQVARLPPLPSVLGERDGRLRLAAVILLSKVNNLFPQIQILRTLEHGFANIFNNSFLKKVQYFNIFKKYV